MEDEEELTLSLTIIVKPEPDISASDKEAFVRGLVLDQVATIGRSYDWGIAVTGTLDSTITDTVTIDDTKPDYQF